MSGMDKKVNCSESTIKSYVLRQGRLTNKQKKAIANAYENTFSYYQEASSERADRQVILEIGFGNGQSLIRQAQENPDIDFIGVEVYPPGVGYLLGECQANEITNIFVYQGDIESFLAQPNLPKWSKVQIYFPDPWHKRRHHKRRLISEAFIQKIESALSFGGLLHILTDWDQYANHIESVMQNADKFTKTALQSRFERAKTKYEMRALKLGHTIHELLYVRS